MNAKFRIVGASFAVGYVIAVMPGTAQALSCDAGYPQLPRDGAVDVPTNAVLWGHFAEVDRLLGPSGEAVDVEPHSLRNEWAVALEVLIPRVPLQPKTDYIIERQYPDSPYPPERTTFRTGAGPSESRPAPPTLIAVEPGVGSTWLSGPGRWLHLELGGVAEQQFLIGDIPDVGAPDGNDPLADLASLQELLVAEPARAQVSSVGPVVEWLFRSGSVDVGLADCTFWPSGVADRQDARFGVVDLVGNFSGWLDVPIELPSDEEAQAAAEAERAATEAEAAERNVQEPRSALANCSAAAPGTGVTGSMTWLSPVLGLGLAVARHRRRG
jgi:hypothetical protein